MYKLCIVNISDYLKQKYYELQFKEKRNVTVEEFANIFGTTQPLMSMWMNGKREPGLEYKKRIIEYYGEEALVAFGEDPDLYAVKENWQYLSPELRSAIRKQTEEHATNNEPKRATPKRRTATP